MLDPQYMNRYWSQLHKDAKALEQLLDEIYPTLNERTPNWLHLPVRESIFVRIGRSIGLYDGPRLHFVVVGFEIPGFTAEELMIVHGKAPFNDGPSLGTTIGAPRGGYIRLSPLGYILDVLSDQGLVGPSELQERFAYLYETLATTFLPESHDLQETAKALRKAITPKKKPAEDDTVAEAALGAEAVTHTA